MPAYNHLTYSDCSAPDKPFELVFHNVSKPEVKLHTHDFMELFWMQKGRCIHLINGEKVELAPNDFGFVMPEDLHGFRWIDGRSYRIANLAFRPGVMLKILKRHALGKDPFWGKKAGKMRLLRLSPEDGSWLDNGFSDLGRGPASELALEHFLLSLILKISPSAEEGKFDKCPAWLRDACMLMSKPVNFCKGPRQFENISGRTLAHLSRILRHSTGKTPVEWITEWRMKYAAERLSATSEQIHDIAAECGFSSLGRFYSVFNQWHGTSPRRYRMRSSHAFPVQGRK